MPDLHDLSFDFLGILMGLATNDLISVVVAEMKLSALTTKVVQLAITTVLVVLMLLFLSRSRRARAS